MPSAIKPKTRLAEDIFEHLKKEGMSVQQLANATGVGYERARTAVSGDKPPSRRLLVDICRILNLDFKVASEMLITEQVKRKFGRLPTNLVAEDSDLQIIEELWQDLKHQEKEHIVWLVRRYSERSQNQLPVLPRKAPRAIRGT